MKLERMLKWLLVLPVVLLTAGCSNDSWVEEETRGGAVDFTIQLYVASSPGTRAWEEPNLDYTTDLQQQIADHDIFVIFYDPSGAIVEIPELEEKPCNTPGVRLVGTKTAKRTSPIYYRVLANVAQGGNFGDTPEAVHAKLTTYIGKTDTDLSNDLRVSGFATDGKWTLSPEGKYLPMQSAKKGPVTLDSDIYESIYVYRSLAKINVEYLRADETFQLTKVRVYNANEYGAFISTEAPALDIYTQFTSPFVIPGTPQRSNYTEYDVTGDKIFNTIYVPEHDNNASSTDLYLQVCFQESGVIDGGEKWYTIYFTPSGEYSADVSDMMDIIRNHSYVFQIKRVSTQLVCDVAEYEVVELKPDFGLEIQ